MNFWIKIDDELSREQAGELLKQIGERITRGESAFDLQNNLRGGQVFEVMSWHGAAEAEGFVACTGWSIDDVKGHYEAKTDGKQLSDEAAGTWLDEHADNLVDVMCGRGNDFIMDMLEPTEFADEEEAEDE